MDVTEVQCARPKLWGVLSSSIHIWASLHFIMGFRCCFFGKRAKAHIFWTPEAISFCYNLRQPWFYEGETNIELTWDFLPYLTSPWSCPVSDKNIFALLLLAALICRLATPMSLVPSFSRPIVMEVLWIYETLHVELLWVLN